MLEVAQAIINGLSSIPKDKLEQYVKIAEELNEYPEDNGFYQALSAVIEPEVGEIAAEEWQKLQDELGSAKAVERLNQGYPYFDYAFAFAVYVDVVGY